MKSYEKKSFLQIFFGYFISVFVFIVILGYLHFEEKKTFIFQKTAMSMQQYILKLKDSDFKHKQDGFTFAFKENKMSVNRMPMKVDNYYVKSFGNKLLVLVEAKIIDKEIVELTFFTLISQILFIILFATISWILALRSLKPMVDVISHLDRFNKDLIHDLNTPITSILLNTKMLKKKVDEEQLSKIKRIENSAKSITSLYSNIEILLDEHAIIKNSFNLEPVITNLIESYTLIYPNISFEFEKKVMNIKTNENSIKRILDNIISNACKYSKETDASIKIEYQNSVLSIQDNGKGIKYPKKVFERSYKESTNGHGIGMHIVHRLCISLDIDIKLESSEKIGTNVILKFN